MSDPVEDGVRFLRASMAVHPSLPLVPDDQAARIVQAIQRIAGPAPYLLDAAYARGVNDGTAAAVQAEREAAGERVRALMDESEVQLWSDIINAAKGVQR